MTRDEFVIRLEAALSEPMTQAQRTVVDSRVAAATARPAQRPRGWRRMTTRTALLVALLVLVVLPTLFGVSAALFWPGSETPFGLAGSSEFKRELEAAKAVTPIPSGYAWPAFLRAESGVSYSRGGGRSRVESVAFCMWQVDWLDARQDGDGPRQAHDRLVILGYPTWESYRGPFADQSYRDLMDRVIAAVDRDDPAPVTANVDLNCRGVRP
jgi:hypothetical protein